MTAGRNENQASPKITRQSELSISPITSVPAGETEISTQNHDGVGPLGRGVGEPVTA